MDNLLEIQVLYKYYANERITPVFLGDEELFSLSYEEFRRRLQREIPHIGKLNESYRLSVIQQDRSEIDISPKYFQSQIAKLINTGLKTIIIRASPNESPLHVNETTKSVATHLETSTQSRPIKRRLDLVQDQPLENAKSIQVCPTAFVIKRTACQIFDVVTVTIVKVTLNCHERYVDIY